MTSTTLQDIVKSLVECNCQIKDFSINGKCSKCGECCSNFLPISQKEIDEIQKYVIEHKIRPQMQMLIIRNTLTCPYHDGKKCLIYEVRPLICREFYCYKKPSAEMAKEFANDTYIPVDMWGIANEIDRYFRRRQ